MCLLKCYFVIFASSAFVLLFPMPFCTFQHLLFLFIIFILLAIMFAFVCIFIFAFIFIFVLGMLTLRMSRNTSRGQGTVGGEDNTITQ